MNQTTISIDKGTPIPKYLWKIKEIDVNVVSFTKHIVSSPIESLNDSSKTIVSISESLGTEIHKVSPDVQLQLSGKVGEWVREFEAAKHSNSVRIKSVTMML